MLSLISSKDNGFFAAALAATCVVSTVGVAPVNSHAAITDAGKVISIKTTSSSSPFEWLGKLKSNISSTSQNVINWDASKSRKTTEREYLIASLRSYERLQENWDGEGAAAPLLSSLRSASSFACALSDSFETPEPMLHATGNAGVVWEHDDFYGELEFYPNEEVAYYFEKNSRKFKGVIRVSNGIVPTLLKELIPKA